MSIITVASLIEVLSGIDQEFEVKRGDESLAKTGNLIVFNTRGEYVGFVDLGPQGPVYEENDS